MEQEFTFYDPLPGIVSTVFEFLEFIKLPESMKKAAKELNGQTMSLEKAMDKLQPIAEELGGTVEIKWGSSISFSVTQGKSEYDYNLIRYKNS